MVGQEPIGLLTKMDGLGNSQELSAPDLPIAIITNLFVYDAIAFIAMLILQFSGAMNALGWGVVFIYLFFTVTFGYYMFPQKKAA